MIGLVIRRSSVKAFIGFYDRTMDDLPDIILQFNAAGYGVIECYEFLSEDWFKLWLDRCKVDYEHQDALRFNTGTENVWLFPAEGYPRCPPEHYDLRDSAY